MAGKKIAVGLNQAIGYNKGWNDALQVAINIAKAIDSNRGNEKLIAEAIEQRKIEFKEKTNETS